MTADRTTPVAATSVAPVLLVGAGPGDPELVTAAAEDALATAREVVADRSLGGLLAELPVSTAVTWVTDDVGGVDVLLAAVARGSGVVRLYRGDPWFHPAGDAERAALRSAGVAFGLVAGVVEELALLARAGIPAQVRTLAVTTTFVVDRTADPVDLAVPGDPSHGLVVRSVDLASTVRRLAARASEDQTTDRPAAVVPVDDAGPVRTTLHALDRVAVSGPGLVVVGLVAALDVGRPAPDLAEVTR